MRQFVDAPRVQPAESKFAGPDNDLQLYITRKSLFVISSENAEKIFAELHVNCITLPDTDEYKYRDNLGYYTGGAWKNRCIGFKNVPDTIDCQACSNLDMRRLCPCQGTSYNNQFSLVCKDMNVWYRRQGKH